MLLLVVLLNVLNDFYGNKVLAYPILNSNFRGLQKRAFNPAATWKELATATRNLKKSGQLKKVVGAQHPIADLEDKYKVKKVMNGPIKSTKEIKSTKSSEKVVSGKKSSRFKKVAIGTAVVGGTAAGAGVGAYYLGKHDANEENGKDEYEAYRGH
ncbi:hypothetical protein CROQUDRAFT_134295 [Cronartium quercuum f. sp. fusiforme G11]|uniref:Uncharacterized protein n=1 Tax=Cronartium quercuum f. sp. fusiforme G11 TaxID=708437 RepID=A0A9P6ND51_9BASI|nr:hypothetical protein CROQUDRAFT_134295 [Cronartium quercuum f. sp. fusiforme G11]